MNKDNVNKNLSQDDNSLLSEGLSSTTGDGDQEVTDSSLSETDEEKSDHTSADKNAVQTDFKNTTPKVHELKRGDTRNGGSNSMTIQSRGVGSGHYSANSVLNRINYSAPVIASTLLRSMTAEGKADAEMYQLSADSRYLNIRVGTKSAMTVLLAALGAEAGSVILPNFPTVAGDLAVTGARLDIRTILAGTIGSRLKEAYRNAPIDFGPPRSRTDGIARMSDEALESRVSLLVNTISDRLLSGIKSETDQAQLISAVQAAITNATDLGPAFTNAVTPYSLATSAVQTLMMALPGVVRMRRIDTEAQTGATAWEALSLNDLRVQAVNFLNFLRASLTASATDQSVVNAIKADGSVGVLEALARFYIAASAPSSFSLRISDLNPETDGTSQTAYPVLSKLYRSTFSRQDHPAFAESSNSVMAALAATTVPVEKANVADLTAAFGELPSLEELLAHFVYVELRINPASVVPGDILGTDEVEGMDPQTKAAFEKLIAKFHIGSVVTSSSDRLRRKVNERTGLIINALTSLVFRIQFMKSCSSRNLPSFQSVMQLRDSHADIIAATVDPRKFKDLALTAGTIMEIMGAYYSARSFVIETLITTVLDVYENAVNQATTLNLAPTHGNGLFAQPLNSLAVSLGNFSSTIRDVRQRLSNPSGVTLLPNFSLENCQGLFETLTVDRIEMLVNRDMLGASLTPEFKGIIASLIFVKGIIDTINDEALTQDLNATNMPAYNQVAPLPWSILPDVIDAKMRSFLQPSTDVAIPYTTVGSVTVAAQFLGGIDPINERHGTQAAVRLSPMHFILEIASLMMQSSPSSCAPLSPASRQVFLGDPDMFTLLKTLRDVATHDHLPMAGSVCSHVNAVRDFSTIGGQRRMVSVTTGSHVTSTGLLLERMLAPHAFMLGTFVLDEAVVGDSLLIQLTRAFNQSLSSTSMTSLMMSEIPTGVSPAALASLLKISDLSTDYAIRFVKSMLTLAQARRLSILTDPQLGQEILATRVVVAPMQTSDLVEIHTRPSESFKYEIEHALMILNDYLTSDYYIPVPPAGLMVATFTPQKDKIYEIK